MNAKVQGNKYAQKAKKNRPEQSKKKPNDVIRTQIFEVHMYRFFACPLTCALDPIE